MMVKLTTSLPSPALTAKSDFALHLLEENGNDGPERCLKGLECGLCM